MADLSDNDVTRIADKMVKRIQATHHDFWIDPQSHYDDHAAISEIIGSWRTAKGIFARAFIGLVVVGSVVLMGIAVMKGVDK